MIGLVFPKPLVERPHLPPIVKARNADERTSTRHRPGGAASFDCNAQQMAHTVRLVLNSDEPGPRYSRVMRGWKNATQPVTQDQWMSQAKAAERLNVNIFRVGWAIACENLDPADGPSGEAGVTVASVDREIQWRANATWVAKVRRGIRSTVSWL